MDSPKSVNELTPIIHVAWSVYINGKKLDSGRLDSIESIDSEEICDGSDVLTITINDTERKFIEDNIFIEEAKIKVEMRIVGVSRKSSLYKFEGYISTIDVDFPEEGYPKLVLHCMDKSHIMNRKKKNRSWDKTTNANVVKAIAKQYGFKCVVQSGYTFKQQDTITQSNQTDIEFCESLADSERVPFMCKLIGNTLYYVKKGLISKAVTDLHYKQFPYDVKSFSPRINKETRQEEVTVSNIDSNNKKVNKGKASDSKTARDTQGKPVKTSSKPTNNNGGSMVFNPETGKWSKK